MHVTCRNLCRVCNQESFLYTFTGKKETNKYNKYK